VPDEVLCSLCYRGKLAQSLRPELATLHETHSLRSIAKEYGISYETVRRR